VALQLRIIDGIRTRVVQIEDRDGTRPVRIGSAPDCDIRVGAGAPVQCEMFIHHGRWVVKNALPNAPIRVGGKVVSKGAYLSAEDRISLGDSERAAVIEVGPSLSPPAGSPPDPRRRMRSPNSPTREVGRRGFRRMPTRWCRWG